MPGSGFDVDVAQLRAAVEELSQLGAGRLDVTAAKAAMHQVVLPEAAGELQAVAEKAEALLVEAHAVMAAIADGLVQAARIYEHVEIHTASGLHSLAKASGR